MRNMRNTGLFFVLLIGFMYQPLFAQEFDPFIQSMVDQLSVDSLENRLQTFEDLGIKTVGSTNLDATGQWIVGLYESWGYDDIVIDSLWVNPAWVYNIVVTKAGTEFPDTYIIVDGHYDTYGGPGVNDNGTGTAIVLEVARIMQNLSSKYSIKFIHFTAEELGLLGSYHYVENTVLPQDLDIKLVFNIDEVGGVAGEVNNTITCERDEWAPNGNNAASAAYTDTLATLTEIYSDLNTWINYAYATDYIPFMENGYVVTGFYEYNESPYPHSINDSLSKIDLDYVFEVTKASLSAGIYFSGLSDITSFNNSKLQKVVSAKINPNPFNEFFELQNLSKDKLQLTIYDLSLRLVFQRSVNGMEKNRINPPIESGIYYYTLINLSNQIVGSGKLISK